MTALDLSSYPVWLNLLLFTAGAAGVWGAGTRLTRYADVIAERTGAGRAFIGALLLGGITSLPEVVTTATASILGNAALAANNVFGGVAMQVAVLVLADAAVRGRALSSVIPRSGVLLQGALLVLVLTLAAAGILVGEPTTLPFGIWTPALFVTGIMGFALIHHYETDVEWEPVAVEASREGKKSKTTQIKDPASEFRSFSTRRIVLHTSLAGAGILVTGFVVARAADVLAEQTGMGSGFAGMALLPVATSLPEISTSLSAARMGRYEMAFANVYGANLLDVGLLFVIDLLYAGGPVLNELGRFSIFGALLGIVTTTVYLAGLIERRGRTVWNMGIDTVMVLFLYLGGMVVLYTLR